MWKSSKVLHIHTQPLSSYQTNSMENHDCRQVKIDPHIFERAVSEIHFKPCANLFASATHHQLTRYYFKGYDPKTVRTNTFFHGLEPYFNPPLSRIARALDKVEKYQIKAMMVALIAPFWTKGLTKSSKSNDPLHDP